MREARRSTFFKYTTWVLAMQCGWTLMSIRMNHPFHGGKSLPARKEDSKLQIVSWISKNHMPYENLDQMNLMVQLSCLPDHYSLRICLTPSAYLPLLHIFVMLRVENSKPGEFPDTAPLLVALPAKEDKVPAKTSVKVKAKSLVVFNSESDFTNGISI
ncbi:hypothetical protein VNO77_46316 [Canavalia gladiata]|uniref:Uncharacterized protein n=1 Tax=Canavalia gladiata TaxID=3824 RepID=A0AAN9JH22_CANGL